MKLLLHASGSGSANSEQRIFDHGANTDHGFGFRLIVCMHNVNLAVQHISAYSMNRHSMMALWKVQWSEA